jgi:hypothetical protein
MPVEIARGSKHLMIGRDGRHGVPPLQIAPWI